MAKSSYSDATLLNEKAISLAREYRSNNDSLNKSLVYLDKAIHLDSGNIWFYVNKMNILASLKQRKESISEANRILKFNSNNVAININVYLGVAQKPKKAFVTCV